MEKIYSQDNYNISYRRYLSNIKRKPGRPPNYLYDTPVNCFICDTKITKQRVNLVQGLSNSVHGFPSQISQILGDEFLIIVQDDDCICKQCVSLLNNMDKLEKQLCEIKGKLIAFMKRKYNLNNNTVDPVESMKEDWAKDDVSDNDIEDDSNENQFNDLYADKSSLSEIISLKCNVCSFGTNNHDEFDHHIKSHVNAVKDDGSNESNGQGVCKMTVGANASGPIKLFNCSICCKMYLTKEMCIEHMRAKHVMDELSSVSSEKSFDDLVNSKSMIEKSITHEVNDSEKSVTDSLTTIITQDKNSEQNYEIEAGKNENINKLSKSSSDTSKVIVEAINDQQISVNETSLKNDESMNLAAEPTKSNDSSNKNDDDSDVDDIGAGDVDYSEDDKSEDSDLEDGDDDEVEEKKHVCGNCGFKGNLINLKEHILEERPQRDLVCSVCGQSFNSFCKLISHSSGHDMDSEPIDCVYCPNGIKLPDILSLNYHMKKKHLLMPHEVLCKNCEKLVPTSEYDEKHRRNDCRLTVENESVGSVENVVNKKMVVEKVDKSKTQIKKKRSVVLKVDKRLVRIDSKVLDDHCLKLDESISNHLNNKMFENESVVSDSFIDESTIINPFVPDDVVNVVDKEEYVLLNTSADEYLVPDDRTMSVVYRCGLCGEQRATRDELMIHFESHNAVVAEDENQENILKTQFCKTCGVLFEQTDDLLRHQKKHFSKSQHVKCLYCARTVHDYLHLKYHIMYHHTKSVGKLYCKLCDIKFQRITLFKKHVISVHKTGHHSCTKCNKVFTFKYKLYRHYRTHHRQDFKCKFCKIICIDSTDLKRHEDRHLKNRYNIYCDICGLTFKTHSALKYHKIRHQPHLDLFCSKCELGFSDVNEMNEHMNGSSHESDTYRCERCDKSITSFNGYRLHMLSHERKGFPYNCKVCSAKFNSSSLLIIHKHKFHKGRYVYNCSFCHCSVSDPSTYKKHLYTHIKRYKYHCKKCLKVFSEATTLTEHKFRVHYQIHRSNKRRVSCNTRIKKQGANSNVAHKDLFDMYKNLDKTKMRPLYGHVTNKKTYV